MTKLLVLLVTGLLCISAPAPAVNTTHETSFVVFPQDCNANPPMLFGGKILAEMDRCAGVTTRRFLYASTVHDAVTVAINDVKFHKPGEVKDLIVVTGTVVKVGEKSITVKVTVERELPDKRELLAEGEFVFVAYDTAAKKSASHGLTLPEVTR